MLPIYQISLRRNSGTKSDARNIYYLTDGTITEVKFFDALFNSTDFVDTREINFIKCEKTGNDEGVSDGFTLVTLAKRHIKSNSAFKSGYDKVLIIFDLDVYDDEKINKLKNTIKNEEDIIFAFSNPAFEVLILMCLEDNLLSKLTADERLAILKNDFIGKDRYIYHYLKTKYKFDSKNTKSDFLCVAKKFNNAIKQQKLINTNLNYSKLLITCNIPYVLNMIQSLKINDIEYFY